MMEKQDFENTTKENNDSCFIKITKVWIFLIFALTVIFFVVVTFDRCNFHNKVYEKTNSEVIKELFKEISVDSLSFSKDSSKVTIYIPDSFEISNDNYERQLNLLSMSDGLLNANSLTYLVTLIVALLAALLLFRVETDETSKEKIRQIKKEAKRLTNEISQLKDKTEEELAFYYIHMKDYNHILTTVENINHVAIMIGNETMKLSQKEKYVHLPIIGNIPVKEQSTNPDNNSDRIPLLIGSLCSWLNLYSDPIINQEHKLDSITSDERDLLFTYLEYALTELERSKSTATSIKDKYLHDIIDDRISLVKKVKDMIGNVKEQEEGKIL